VSGIKTSLTCNHTWAKAPASRRALVGDLDGTWTIPAAYIQAFVQSHPATTALRCRGSTDRRRRHWQDGEVRNLLRAIEHRPLH